MERCGRHYCKVPDIWAYVKKIHEKVFIIAQDILFPLFQLHNGRSWKLEHCSFK
jgi:hypothetical protein